MTVKKQEIKRRDATGHLDAEYRRRLLSSSRLRRSGDADMGFLSGPRTTEPLAAELGEAFLQSATSGEESEPERLQQIFEEEEGGPFLAVRASREFARGTDESNIPEAFREPLPKTSVADP